MRYYVDKQWHDRYGSYSYEIPVERYYYTEREAQSVCDDMNKNMPLEKNEFYCVCEDEEGEVPEPTVKQMRESMEMTQVRFSEFTGIPYRTLQNWESGSSKCPEYVLDMLNELIRPYLDDTQTGYTWFSQEEAGADIYENIFLTKEAALADARSIWDHLTDSEKKDHSVSIGKCKLMRDEYDDQLYPDLTDGIYYQQEMSDLD